MKAPDKIYLPKEEVEDRRPWIEQPCEDDPNWDVCYIRKDALLEWAKEKYDKAFRLHLKKGDKYHYGLGKMHAYKILIDKLNSRNFI